MEPARTLTSASFDVVPFWDQLQIMLEFVQGRLLFGQTDIEGAKMDGHIVESYMSLRKEVIKDDNQGKQACRLIFWDDCKRSFDHIFDSESKVPRSSMMFEDLYRTLHGLQTLVFSKSGDFWKSGNKPNKPPFPEEAPHSRRRNRSRSPKVIKQASWWSCQKCSARMPSKLPFCEKCGAGKPLKSTDQRMGKNGIWQWRNPPGKPLYEGEGFFVFFKPAYWVCSTPEDPKEFERFQPDPGNVDGNFTMWIREKYASKHPFMNEYNKTIGMEYGLLNRLDRETSGPVIVCKNHEAWRNIKGTRDSHNWHKEYHCLVHGQIPQAHWEGVISENIEEASDCGGKKTSWGKVSEPGSLRGKRATSVFEVLEYYERPDEKWPMKFTLVKVRIITGVRHQIRVHMQHLLRKLGPEQVAGSWDEQALVSDFLYMKKRDKLDWDTKNICERVFLHERRLGMWDPEDPDRIVSVDSPMPRELKDCLQSLTLDTKAKTKLEKFKAQERERCVVQRFCQTHHIDALVKRDLEKPFWRERPRLRRALFTEFEKRTSDREKANEDGWLNGLNVNGDHTLLMRGILEDLENWWRLTYDSDKELASTVLPTGTLCETLRMYIDDRIWGQDRRTSGSAEQEGEGDQPLPPGWRRIERDGQVIYLHENGQRQRRRPVEDADLPQGWVKLATSRPDVFIYHHAGTNMTKETRPAADDHLIPQGWEKVPSRGSVTVPFYYRHKATGKTQLGLPCEGPPEELLENWEKVASSRPGQKPYYFNRSTAVKQYEKPVVALPVGWKAQTSSQGRVYYYHAKTGVSQFVEPT